MGIYATLLDREFVHAVPEALRDGPDRREQRRQKEKREGRERPAEPHPVPNAQGEMTGKVVDLTA